MNAVEFSQYADELIGELSPFLADVATDFFREQGRGLVTVVLRDADDPSMRQSALSYVPLGSIGANDRAATIVSEYDPARTLILRIQIDEMQIMRHLRFAELRQLQQLRVKTVNAR